MPKRSAKSLIVVTPDTMLSLCVTGLAMLSLVLSRLPSRQLAVTETQALEKRSAKKLKLTARKPRQPYRDPVPEDYDPALVHLVGTRQMLKKTRKSHRRYRDAVSKRPQMYARSPLAYTPDSVINFRTEDAGGARLYFKTKGSTTIGKMMQEYHKRATENTLKLTFGAEEENRDPVPLEEIVFTFVSHKSKLSHFGTPEPRTLQPDDTIASIGVQDNDTIDVYMLPDERQGGIREASKGSARSFAQDC